MNRTVRRAAAVLLAALSLTAFLPARASAAAASDRYFYLQWALNNDGSFSGRSDGVADTPARAGIDIGMEKAWDEYTASAGRGVTVAIIDTGADISNSDLAGHLWTNAGEIPGNGLDDDGNGYADDVHGWNFRDDSAVIYTAGQDGHGTHCLGTIAAACNSTGIAGICGAAPEIRVMILKAFDGITATGNNSDIIEAIKYARANGASIVNLSLGEDTYSDAMYSAIRDSGLLFVTSAGNYGKDSDVTPVYPAAFDLANVISVANVDCSGALQAMSNYGAKTVDIAAPGTSILGYGTGGNYYYMTGTSMSAPMVTGVAALVYSHFAGISLLKVKDIILSTAKPLASLSGKTVTGGMLDAAAALAYRNSAPAFSDVHTGDWFYGYVSSLAASGVVNGYPDGTFRPKNSVTVGEALKLILLAAGYGEQAPSGGSWAGGYRDLAVQKGFVSASDAANLSAPASRLFIARTAAKAMGLSPSASASPFCDADDPYATALFERGVITGSADASGRTEFRPAASVTRAEMSAVVYRMTR